MTGQKRALTDWEAILREFRAGQLSVCEIARQHGISDAAIRKKAKAQGWVRDLGDKVRQETRAKLAREDAAQAVVETSSEAGSGFGSGSGSRSSHEEDARTIDMASDRGVTVVRRHRALTRRGLGLLERMLDEIDAVTTHQGELAAMIEEATKGDKTPQRYNAMMKAIEVPGRIAALKDASMTAKNFLPLERQAHSLDDEKQDDENSLAKLLERSMPPEGRLRVSDARPLSVPAEAGRQAPEDL